jgi:Family of unknown function (DUF6152)
MSYCVPRLLSMLLGLLLSTTGFAHHGVTTKFDPQQPQQVQGRISRIDWANPHVHLFLQVDQSGEEQSWYVELESPQLLELNGWTEQTLLPGEIVAVTGPRARDGSRQLWGASIKRIGSSESLLTTSRYPTLASSIVARTPELTPRWPDGTPRLGAPPGRAGYWVPTTTTLQETGANVAMAANGQLASLSDAAKVAPLQEWALRLYEFRQRTFLASDPTFVACRPPAGPRKFLNPFGIQLLEDKPLQRIFVIAGGGNHDWHLLYTDGRELDSEDFQLDASNLLYYGRNTAHWEGDTFVNESAGYNERFWLPGGLPHSELMQVTEKLRRPDYDTLSYELTINDPGTYTRPWQASWTLQWLEGQDPPEHYCQDNRL